MKRFFLSTVFFDDSSYTLGHKQACVPRNVITEFVMSQENPPIMSHQQVYQTNWLEQHKHCQRCGIGCQFCTNITSNSLFYQKLSPGIKNVSSIFFLLPKLYKSSYKATFSLHFANFVQVVYFLKRFIIDHIHMSAILVLRHAQGVNGMKRNPQMNKQLTLAY